MCENVASQLGNLMTGIEPTVISLETMLGVINTPDGQASIAAYNAALEAVENWKPGTDAQTVIQLIAAFTKTIDAISASGLIPPEATGLINIIAAGVTIVVSILTGNSPVAADEASQKKVMHDAMAKVKVLVPSYKESLADKIRAAAGDHSVAANEYKRSWNKEVSEVSKTHPKYASLKVA